MSEIHLRLDSDTYTAGDTIHGAVYLKIDGPTSGYGIRVCIKGQEKYMYHDVRKLKELRLSLGDSCVIQDSVVVLDEQLILCLRKSPFAIGQYVLPFKASLARHLPSSFDLRSWHGPRWEASVSYHISAELMGSERTCVMLPLRISAYFLSTPHPMVQTQNRVGCSKVIRQLKTTFYMTAILDKSGYSLGDTVKLTMQINSVDTPVTYISIKILRSLKFETNGASSTVRANCSLCNPNWICDSHIDCEEGIYTENSTTLLPENGTHTVWSAFLPSKAMQGSQIPTIFILLSSDLNGFALQPTVHSTHIQCHYTIQLVVELEVGEKIAINMPLPHIGIPMTSDKVSWEDRDWMGSSNVILPDLLDRDETDWAVYRRLKFPTLHLMRSPKARRKIRSHPRSIPLTEYMATTILPKT